MAEFGRRVGFRIPCQKWRTGSNPVLGKMNVFHMYLLPFTYGIVFFIFFHSIALNYFYSSLKRNFKIAYSVTTALIFISSTFNFVSFFLNEEYYIQILDLLLISVVFSMFLLMSVAFNKKYVLPNVIVVSCFLATLIFSVLGLYLIPFFDNVTFSKVIYFLLAFSVFLVFYDLVLGVIKKDQNYINSDVYFGWKQTIVGLFVLFFLFVLKFVYYGFSYNFYGLSFLVIMLSVFYSRANYKFFLKSKLLEENEKFMTLYRTVVDDIIIGKKVIDKLLPNKKTVKGLEFDAYFKPVLLVGGDFFDIIPLSETKFVSYVTDVSGHGVSAGIIVSMMKALISKEVLEKYSDLNFVVKNLNADFNNLVRDTGRYATLFMVFIDKTKKKFSYVSCGHTECIYWSSKVNQFFLLSSTAPVLGLFNRIDVYSSDVDFDENDFLILLSDGVFSITGKDGNSISYDSFINVLSKYISTNISPSELYINVYQEIGNFIEFGQVVDDITIVFIKL